jgi:transposase
MLKPGQYKKILSLNQQGHSSRDINWLTGHSRNTIRKVLDIKTTPPFRTEKRLSKLDKYKDHIREKFIIGTFTCKQIHDDLLDYGYDGSYSSIRRYLVKHIKPKEQESNKVTRTKRKLNEQHTKWLFDLLHKNVRLDELEKLFGNSIDYESIKILFDKTLNGSLRYRKRALTVFAHLYKIPKRRIAEILGSNRTTIRRYISQFESGGTKELFDFRRKEVKKFEEPKYRENVFKILHSPPSCYGFNRTTWRMEDLYQTMRQEGHSLAKSGIRNIIKNEGYRLIKARKVLTSNDPLYREKVKEITSILSTLGPHEKFFSIDEFGPLAIKIHGGRSWTPPGDQKTFPQWQKSKGCLIITAALELSTNQVTHFYSSKKNTHEMIQLLEILLKRYNKDEQIYFSWDAASWHASKKLYEKVDEVNDTSYRAIYKTPVVSLAPLPSCAQFLNVIESVFSGMARAIIHNSNYQSIEECKTAIDRYFDERNKHFLENPKRAGRKIWGKEITKAQFSESNNCKDPLF